MIADWVPRSTWASLSFCDAFTGSTTVALAAKAAGFGQVIACDRAERGTVTARALIANSSVQLRKADTAQALTTKPAAQAPALLAHLRQPLRRIVAALHGYVAQTEMGPTRDLVTVLLLHLCIRAFPMGVPDTSDALAVASGDLDRASPSRLGHYLRHHAQLARPDAILEFAERINAGVIPGRGQAVRGDALELLASIESDVCYLDPPYGATRGYERTFALIDELLGDEPLERSEFSTRAPPLDELLGACRGIGLVTLSLGNAALERSEVEALVARHRRRTRVIEIPRRHLASLASAEKNARSAEYLVIAQ